METLPAELLTVAPDSVAELAPFRPDTQAAAVRAAMNSPGKPCPILGHALTTSCKEMEHA